MLAQPATPAGRIAVGNPYDGSPIASVDALGPDGVEQALATAHALFRDRDAWLPAHRRIAILNRTAELMAQRTEQLARLAAAEGGIPLVDSRVEVTRAIDGVRNCAELLRNQGGREIPMGATPASAGRLAFTRHEPIGPVVAVSAFNHPLNLIVHQVGPGDSRRLSGDRPFPLRVRETGRVLAPVFFRDGPGGAALQPCPARLGVPGR